MTTQLSLKIDTGLSKYSVEIITRELVILANESEAFTADDVHDRLPATTQHSLSLYPQALGAIIKGASKAGWIMATGRTVRTRRPEGRGRRIVLWRRAA